jgi:hypothetical protein
MGQMTNPKQFIIIIGTCQEMMAWMGMELIGSVDVSWQDFGSQQVGQITADFCQAPTTNLTKHDSHGPDDQPKTIDHQHWDMSRDAMAWMIMELIGSVDVSWQDFGSQVGQITADHALTTNLTQYDSHGPDEQPKTIDYNHLGMSRDDGMDEHGIDWLCGFLLAGFWLTTSWANHS